MVTDITKNGKQNKPKKPLSEEQEAKVARESAARQLSL
jgi:hypothetical protein